MKALSLRQPWASLVALGVKTVETRSWSTSYRGPLAIHAATRHFDIRDLAALITGEVLDRWCDAGLVSVGGGRDLIPKGKVVATCTLTDVVRIGGEHSFRSANWQGDEQEHQNETVIVGCDGSYDRPRLVLDTPDKGIRDISDQEPYGDFTPGRYGWLLGDILPLAEPVSARGRQRLWEWTP